MSIDYLPDYAPMAATPDEPKRNPEPRVKPTEARRDHWTEYTATTTRAGRLSSPPVIIGQSAAANSVRSQIDIVAPTDATVLILGETGTGKELVAQAVHQQSRRAQRPFIRINCAAIPSGLLESELFGHERGAFTGALARRIGRFELAHGGTLFLDEIGDIPLDLQAKLLRVLQEQEFERVGSTQTVRVNVRLIAATSRDLGQMLADQAFRADLYYRVSVFPLRVPPLRERPDDIPLLVEHFVAALSRQMNKRIAQIPSHVMDALTRFRWPGNIRELRNFIERAVILSPGRSLCAPLQELCAMEIFPAATRPTPSTLKDVEHAHIVRALEATHWVVGGPRGAAARLGVNRTTLISKMQRMGIVRTEPERIPA